VSVAETRGRNVETENSDPRSDVWISDLFSGAEGPVPFPVRSWRLQRGMEKKKNNAEIISNQHESIYLMRADFHKRKKEEYSEPKRSVPFLKVYIFVFSSHIVLFL
jgi:hypothetical protein